MHILGDIVNSIGVIIASLIIWASGGNYVWIDPICTYIFSIIVFYTTRITFLHVTRMLMEGTPAEVSFEGIQKAVLRVHGVKSVYCLHVWSIG